jgi:MFS family permease
MSEESSNRDVMGIRAMPPENRLALIVAALSLVAGGVALAVLSGTAQLVAASVLFGLAGIALVSLVFLLIGQSEEADRRRHPRG